MASVDNNIFLGYNDYSTLYSATDLDQEEFFQDTTKSNNGFKSTENQKFSGSGMRLGTSSGYQRGSTAGRPGTGTLRPMTAVRGAGYTSASRQTFDPLNLGSTIQNFPLETEKEETPEEKIKQAERRIMTLIEESAKAGCEKNVKVALERAREASSRERVLIRLQEQAGLSDSHNIDLTFAVIFNLACQYSNNEMYTEAIATYQAITRNRNFSNSARLKVNIGNIYVKMGQLSQAIKMYRMALDQTTNAQKYLRIKIMHNIGMLFVRMGRLEEAANSFEWVMREKPDLKAGMHAILCHFALSQEDKMKKGFLELLDVPLHIDHDDKYSINTDDIASNILNETVKNDDLSKLERELKVNAEKTILNAANLIAPVIEETLAGGFAWCVDAIKSSGYHSLAANLEINKAMVFLYNREVRMAIESLKIFENQDTKINSSASTVLSFIHFLRGEYDLAEKYGEAARIADNYNTAAYVNLSACSIVKNDLQSAKEYLLCALENDPNHVQALYNLGLLYKKKNMFEQSLECFWKLKNIVRYDPLTLYQIGHVSQLSNNVEQSSEWYNQLLGIISSDPGILQKLGEMYDNVGDKQQAYQYYSDSYSFYPANFDVINWLGSYFISMQVPEKALAYFKEAVELAPNEPKWRLLVASCLRRAGQFHKAFTEYQDIHKKFPDNIECLKFLIRLCNDLGLKEAQTYAIELRKLEKTKENKDGHGSGKAGTSNSRQSNSGTSSRGGSEMSTFSEHQTSPALHEHNFQHGDNTHFSHHILTDSFDVTTESSVLDTHYVDPVGSLPTRPMTAAGKKDSDFGDEQLGVDLLPE
ncbi:PREDICTED: intraflagellar transport protein 88 homolog [Ceratosolen solmsi marchali]|uniref:Intraflagellar transport protein 88 homolog n=1 Tax=Ceratosolen solmsi marchali TaxID=326594 RepID=A0AAJ6YKT5_9HYME|nr:PREDICTED: intraflagellar transport protein 88 homolog [Ceratosolen solmsi marchali]